MNMLIGVLALAMISLMVARHRERSLISAANAPEFNGSDLRMYYVYTEMYRILHTIFIAMACYITFDSDDHFKLATIIGIIGGLCVFMRLYTIILFLLAPITHFEIHVNQMKTMFKIKDDVCEK